MKLLVSFFFIDMPSTDIFSLFLHCSFFFFLNDPAPTEISPLPLHDPLPISGTAASLTGLGPVTLAQAQPAAPDDLTEATIAELQAAMAAGQLTSISLVNVYLQRIATLDQSGPRVNSIIEVNPDARAIALARDAERRAGIVRGPLHGIPVVLKDNIDTADKMQTAAGSALRV